MAEISDVEIKEERISNSLLDLENKTFDELPQEIAVQDKGLMTSLRLMVNRTKAGRKEWSGYITKDRASNLTLDVIQEGISESQSQQVIIKDFTGFFNENDKMYQTDRDVLLPAEMKQHEFRVGSRPIILFGRGLPNLPKEKLHPGVVMKPKTEFFGLAHTHPDGEAHSIGDLAMAIVQTRRPDGRVTTPVSIVVGRDNFYVLVVPIDGQIEQRSDDLRDNIIEEVKNRELEKQFEGFMRERGYADIYQAQDPFIELVLKERKFGFYKGSTRDGVLKRVV